MTKSAILALIFVAAAIGTRTYASPPAVEVALRTDSVAPAGLTATDAEAWLDGYMPYALRRGGVAGAVVVIVKDEHVLVAKGYGVSDTRTGAPVDPQQTLFRVGSVSKLFTWTAVMQQVESGKIDLDADVNRYIDFTIPSWDGQPITMRNIMTHTTGFEERVKGIVAFDPRGLPSLGQALKNALPARICAPGTRPAYSNYAVALAGYIVQRVSGEEFDTYIERHIFKPLNMTNSTFRQPLPPSFASQMSKGYLFAGGNAEPFELLPMDPAGALSSSGDDMAKFMIAHLSSGGGILKPETTSRMHETALSILAPLDGMALGFFEERINGIRGIGHGGDIRGFHSHLNLWPDQNVGMFVAMNSDGRDGASDAVRTGLYEGFANRYLPRGGANHPAGAFDTKLAAHHAALMANSSYVFAWTGFGSFYSFRELMGQSRITVNGDGTITPDLLTDLGGAPRHYREVANFLWQMVGGHSLLKAKVVDGKVALWSISEYSPAFTLVPVDRGRSVALLLPLLDAAGIVLMLTLLGSAAGVIAGYYGRTLVRLTICGGIGCQLALLSATVTSAAAASWAYIFSERGGDLESIAWLSHHDSTIRLVEAITLVAILGGLTMSLTNAFVASVAFRERGSWVAILWNTLSAAAYLVFLWTVIVFGMVNFSVKF